MTRPVAMLAVVALVALLLLVGAPPDVAAQPSPDAPRHTLSIETGSGDPLQRRAVAANADGETLPDAQGTKPRSLRDPARFAADAAQPSRGGGTR